MITIVDYKMGNLGSILNMLKKIGAPARISSNPAEIEQSDKIILPGVGSFDAAMRNLEEMNLRPILEEMVVARKTPTLGICLGMQLMTKRSDEGKLPGLGWFDAEVKKFEPDLANGIKVPHMGWNVARPTQQSPLFELNDEPQRFYFVHSYYVRTTDPAEVLTSTHYSRDFASGIIRGQLAGVQFHPEKSHKFGMRLLKNFAEKF